MPKSGFILIMIQVVNITSADAAMTAINIVMTCLIFLVCIVLTLLFLGWVTIWCLLKFDCGSGADFIWYVVWGQIIMPPARMLEKLTFFTHYFLLIPLAVLLCKLNDVFVVRFNREVCAVDILTTGRTAYSH